jgi:hypothetical protein
MDIQLGSQYTQQGLFHAISMYNFPDSEKLQHLLYATRYLFQYKHYDSKITPTTSQLIHFTEKLFNKYKTHDIPEVAEIVDILIQYSPPAINYLNELRQIDIDRERILRVVREEKHIDIDRRRILQVVREEKHIDFPIFKPPKKLTVYEDTQNVHNTTINESAKIAVKKLVNLYDNNIQIKEIHKILLEKFPQHSTSINKVIKRIDEDVANFGINVSLKQTLRSLWSWIYIQNKEEDHDELLKILVNEIKDMSGMCATGHLTRLINVTQGFDNEFIIKISDNEQCSSVVTHYLNTQLQHCDDDDVLDGMTTKEQKFIEFIDDCIRQKEPEWRKEYGNEFVTHINQIVNKFIDNT